MSGRGSNKRDKSGFQNPLFREAAKGFRGYPLAKITYYGSSADTAERINIEIIAGAETGPAESQTWQTVGRDIRGDKAVNRQVMRYIQRHNARTVEAVDKVIIE